MKGLDLNESSLEGVEWTLTRAVSSRLDCVSWGFTESLHIPPQDEARDRVEVL